VLYYLGMLGPVSGQTGPEMIAEMKEALRKAIALKPDFADAYNLLAFAYGAEQDWAAAAEAMKQAVKLLPREEKYADGLARYLMRLQKWDEAEPIWRTLTTSQDEALAAGARQQLEFLSDVRARTARGGAPPSGLALRSGSASAPATEAPPQPEEPLAAPVPVQFLKGTLLDVDCSRESGGAVLRVQSEGRVWTMLATETKRVVVIGADEFDCGWTKKKVAINYRPKGDAGEIVSLELQ
jgi:tetratricopeptide (TPR) repeat protein